VLCGAVFHKFYILTAMPAAGSNRGHRPHTPLPDPRSVHEHPLPGPSSVLVYLKDDPEEELPPQAYRWDGTTKSFYPLGSKTIS